MKKMSKMGDKILPPAAAATIDDWFHKSCSDTVCSRYSLYNDFCKRNSSRSYGGDAASRLFGKVFKSFAFLS